MGLSRWVAVVLACVGGLRCSFTDFGDFAGGGSATTTTDGGSDDRPVADSDVLDVSVKDDGVTCGGACMNGGACDGGGNTCKCAAGFTGSRCQTLLPSFLWLDASDATSVVFKGGGGLEVAEWRDKSGLARHVTVPTGSTAPVWVDNVINARPAVLFNGNTVRLQTGPVATSAEMTVFVVFNMVTPAAWGSLINQELTAYYFSIRRLSGAPGLLFQIDKNFETPVLPLILDRWKVVTALRQGTTSTMYYTPESATSHTGDTLRAGVPVVITIGNALTLAESMGGFISEIRAFNTALDAAARAGVEAELKTKYAIP